MSLSVTSITKSYGSQTVLDRISFKAESGEILGFLGPNGAGKTTTMKIITGYTASDEGDVIVCGESVKEAPLSVKKKIGYLPEHNPLYGNMYIKEYLAFIARLHGIRNIKDSVNRMIDQTGLSKEQHKQIKMLSKGYRQRVGLAQALLHDPEVLILDEPTSGLDPNQLEDIRNLIRTLGEQKTVVFSSHIMQEVQALCDRVLIINEGKIVADDKIDQLEQYISSGYDRIQVEFESGVSRSYFKKLDGFVKLHVLEDHKFFIDCKDEFVMRKAVFELAKEKSLPLIGLQKQDVTVENVFQALTK